jgi:bacterioferritin
MKGNVDLIETLNSLLRDELTAINQYMVHSEMCANWGLERLHKATEKRAVDEMKHAEKLIGRILFLEGTPMVGRLNELQIGPDVAAQLKNDHLAEAGAVRAYNQAIAQAAQASDNGTRELLESILKDEEAHIDRLEAQLDQVKQMGMQNFLAQQVASS